jgi:Arc/MetJ family transcription regulator
MKKTIELDEKKIQRIMRLCGLKTQREALDFALTHGERIAKALKAFEGSLYLGEGAVIDSRYDLLKLRESDRPRRPRAGTH